MSGFAPSKFQFLLTSGAPNASGKIYVYQTGTTTPVTIYNDGGLTVPASNPLTLDSNGEGKFYISGSTNLRIDSYSSQGAFIETIDPVFPVSGISSSNSGTVVYQGTNLTLSTTNLQNNIIATSGVNIALPLSTGFTNSFQCQLNAQSGAITLSCTSPDAIQKGSAGASYTMPKGSSGELWTDATGNWGINFLSNGATPNYFSPGGFVNKFRNAAMDVAQRGASGTVPTGNANYTVDGWIVSATGATATWAQSYGKIANLSANFLLLTGASSLTDTFVKQRIESIIAVELANNQVTVQFFLQNGLASGSITPTLTINTPTAQDNYGSVTAVVSAVPLQTLANNTSGVLSYTFACPSGANDGLEVILDFGASLNSSGNHVYVSQADIRVTPGVSTGLNSSPPAPEIRPITSELPACQRYLPAYNAPSGSTLPVTDGMAGNSTSVAWLYKFKVSTRVPPVAIAVSSNSHFNSGFYSAGSFLTAGSLSSMAIGGATTESAFITAVSSATGEGAAQSNWLFSVNAGAQLLFTGAEL